MAAKSNEKILLGLAAVVAIASAAVFVTLTLRQAAQIAAPIARVELSEAPYVATVADAPPVKIETWNPPPAQTRGREWIYDAFTPPEIFYNARTKQFTVKPPSSLAEGEPEEEFGLELVAVRPEPFRLQLIGYVGGEGTWRGTFENTASGEVFLGAAGKKVASLGVTIKSLDVRSKAVALPQSMTTYQRVATAVVHDDRSGRDVTLTHRERHFTGTVTALVAEVGESATREVRQGDTFKIGAATYRVEQVQLVPPQAEITKESPTLSHPDRRTIAPREVEGTEKPEGNGGNS